MHTEVLSCEGPANGEPAHPGMQQSSASATVCTDHMCLTIRCDSPPSCQLLVFALLFVHGKPGVYLAALANSPVDLRASGVRQWKLSMGIMRQLNGSEAFVVGLQVGQAGGLGSVEVCKQSTDPYMQSFAQWVHLYV